MPNVTLYVKESDLPAINQAKAELGDSLSSVFVDCIRERLDRKEPSGAMEKITLLFWNENQDPVIKKSFVGRWLVGGPDEGMQADDDSQSWDADFEWSVAQTQKGGIVSYVRGNHRQGPTMDVYGSFEEFRDDAHSRVWPPDVTYLSHPRNVIAAAAAELGEPYEIVMDI